MRLDNYSRLILNEQDVFELIYENKLDIIPDLIVDNTNSIRQFNQISPVKINTSDNLDYIKTLEFFDLSNQKTWFIPDEYKNMDIEEYLIDICPKENYQRLQDELQEFKDRDMLNLLRWLKFFVDICRKNNIVWGVGRGSSVSSYVLFLIGIHKIDSVKYKLDWREFLR